MTYNDNLLQLGINDFLKKFSLSRSIRNIKQALVLLYGHLIRDFDSLTLHSSSAKKYWLA